MLEKKGGGKVSTIRTREDWLNEFVRESRPVFRDRGFTVPDLVRVSIGFTSKGKKSKAIGECWNAEASRDRHFEIFIHPGLLGNRSRVADVVTHEVCHTIVPEAKHGQPFKRVAIAIGLVGKMTETEAGPKWHDWADPIVEGLGEIPGSELNCQSPTRAKEGTRLLKAECAACGLVFRITRKWIDAVQELRCPNAACDGRIQTS